MQILVVFTSLWPNVPAPSGCRKPLREVVRRCTAGRCDSRCAHPGRLPLPGRLPRAPIGWIPTAEPFEVSGPAIDGSGIGAAFQSGISLGATRDLASIFVTHPAGPQAMRQGWGGKPVRVEQAQGSWWPLLVFLISTTVTVG